MTYRGIVQDGVIVLDGGAKLADGTAVQIQALDENGKSLLCHPALGIWRERADLSDSSEASRRLRRQLEKRGGHG
ncbi:MAG: hypothetical protein IID43_05030 [Planctomycetes bacterium]|nr:hypothetical protein [Planctomycetota bacterium]